MENQENLNHELNEPDISSVSSALRKRNEGEPLTDDEFETLSEFAFLLFQEKNPPIPVAFSPEDEFLKLQEMSKKERTEAIPEFKEKLARQRRALVECRLCIEREIEHNNDVSKEHLILLADQFGSAYGFSENQCGIIEKLIDSYFSHRKKALEMRDTFPDNKALVQKLTGMFLPEPSELDISVGPMSVDIYTDEFTANRVYEHKPLLFVKGSLCGFADVGVDDIFFTVQTPIKQKNTLVHEHEHVKNNLFKGIFEKEAIRQEIDQSWNEYAANKQYPKKGRIFLEENLNANMKSALSTARDEILARKKDGGTYDYVSLFSGATKYYDYFAPLKKMGNEIKDPVWSSIQGKTIMRYEKIISGAVTAFDTLIREGGYTTDGAIALLSDKPLVSWAACIHKLMREKSLKKKAAHENIDFFDTSVILRFSYENNYQGLYKAMKCAKEKDNREIASFIVDLLGRKGLQKTFLRIMENENISREERMETFDWIEENGVSQGGMKNIPPETTLWRDL